MLLSVHNRWYINLCYLIHSSVVLAGHSAGAHLVAMVAMSSGLSSQARMIVKGMSIIYNVTGQLL